MAANMKISFPISTARQIQIVRSYAAQTMWMFSAEAVAVDVERCLAKMSEVRLINPA